MENWIGVAIWIFLGALIALAARAVIKRPEETSGHTLILVVLGGFAAVIGGMLGVGIFHLYDPDAISVGGMGGAVVLAVLFTSIYRWGIRGLI